MSHLKETLEEDVIVDGLSLKDQHFLDILFDEHKGNIRSAMLASGYPKSTPSSAVTLRLKNQIQERAKIFLATSTAKAVISLVDVIDDPNVPGTKNILTAAKEILDRGGVFKEETITVQQQDNMFILPAKESSDEDE